MLIGNTTAGPAEIVASAIAGNHRGETVGDRSYGVASMQKLIQLDDGSASFSPSRITTRPTARKFPSMAWCPPKSCIPRWTMPPPQPPLFPRHRAR